MIDSISHGPSLVEGWLSFANVSRVTTSAGGRPVEVFVFDHHRTAFALWAAAARTLGGPLALVTLDRHMDLAIPRSPPPALSRDTPALDAYARLGLGPANDEQIAAAFEAGAISDALIIARSHPPPSLAAFQPYRDRTGGAHACAFARDVEGVGDDGLRIVEASRAVALDIDLDCFTTLSDAHVDEPVPWDLDHIDLYLRPPGSEPFWSAVLSRTRLVTIAREPYHCGGLGRAARLWLDFARIFFERILGSPPP